MNALDKKCFTPAGGTLPLSWREVRRGVVDGTLSGCAELLTPSGGSYYAMDVALRNAGSPKWLKLPEYDRAIGFPLQDLDGKFGEVRVDHTDLEEWEDCPYRAGKQRKATR